MGRSSALLTAAFAGLMLVSIQASAAPRGAQQIQVHNIDVGQGSATLIQTIGGKNILVDTGWDFAGKRLVAYMKKIGVKKLDAVVITHRHMDHIGGAQAVAEAFPVARVIGPWAKSGIPNSAMVHLAHMRKDLNEGKTAGNRPAYQAASTGKVFDFGNGFKLETLWPKVPSSGKRIGDYNEESVTMRVSQAIPGKRGVKPATFLVAGDLGVAEERWVARTMPGKLKVDWIVSNHHGSKGSSQREYMVATGDGYSRMLRALILGQGTRDQFVFKTARKFYDEVKGGRYAAAVLKNLDPLYKPRRPLIEGSRLDRMVKGIKQIQKWDADKGRPPRYAVYSTGPNAYGHPNATRMAEAVLAGFAPITTWANSASVVMTRKVGSDGKWDSGWTPSARSSRGLPRMKMPGWLGKTDEDKPYNNDRREANSHWQRLNPHPEVSWTANWDTSQTWRGLARKNAKGRKQWVEEYVALKKDATEGTRDGVKPRNASQKAANKRAAQRKLKSMQYSARKEWHGLNLRGMKELSREQLKVLVSGRGQKVSKGQGDRLDPVAAADHAGEKMRNTFSDRPPTRSRTSSTRTRLGGRGLQNFSARFGAGQLGAGRKTPRMTHGNKSVRKGKTSRPRTRKPTRKARVAGRDRATRRIKTTTGRGRFRATNKTTRPAGVPGAGHQRPRPLLRPRTRPTTRSTGRLQQRGNRPPGARWLRGLSGRRGRI